MPERLTGNRIKNSTVVLTSLLLVILSLFGSLDPSGLHAIVAHHNLPLAHRSGPPGEAVEHDLDEHCGHSSHITASDACGLCDVAYYNCDSVFSSFDLRIPSSSREHYREYKPRLRSFSLLIASSRAPPRLRDSSCS